MANAVRNWGTMFQSNWVIVNYYQGSAPIKLSASAIFVADSLLPTYFTLCREKGVKNPNHPIEAKTFICARTSVRN